MQLRIVKYLSRLSRAKVRANAIAPQDREMLNEDREMPEEDREMLYEDREMPDDGREMPDDGREMTNDDDIERSTLEKF